MASETAVSTLTMPKPVDFPPLAGDPVSQGSWKTLMAIMDAVIPSVQRADSLPPAVSIATVNLPKEEYETSLASLRQYAAPSEDRLKQQDLFEVYLAERPSENPVFERLLRHILSHAPPAKKRNLEMVLSLLGTRGGSLLLTGYVTPLTSLSISDRTKILHSWRTSALYALRGLFKTFTTLSKLVHIRTSAYHSPLTGFPTIPASWVANNSFPYKFLDFSSPSFAPKINSKTGTPIVEIETDIVIIGSGCGAGVVAHRLATTFGRNLRILVLEKGQHFDTSHFPLSQEVGLSSLMEAGGVIESEDGSITVTAGSTFGGGGTVNWSASLQTQHFVRKEWAQDRKLPFFESEAFQACLDRVCGVMGVSDAKVVPNHGNKVLLEGARRLGYEARVVPQNCKGEAHEDGHCGAGCWRGEKMGPANGWYPEATRKGDVRFVQGMKADKVLFGKDKKKRKGKKGKVAVGVTGTWTPTGTAGGKSVKVVVKAKKVVVSAGTLWSPVVLMNSGISNPHLGKNLKLHPTSFVTAVFEHETKPWEGACLTSVINSFENLDGKGHGIKIEALCMLPGFALTFLPWVSGLNYKLMAARYRHLNTYFSIARDRDSGHIYRDPETGTPQVVYTPSEYDRGNIMVGTLAICKILYVQGAKEIHPSLPGFRPFIRSSSTALPTSSTTSADALADMDMDKAITDPAFLAWLADLKAHGNKPPQTAFGSAHQMGTCRMGATASEGVVDPKGRVWGTEGLYVADASVFPSASGVNPMITNMAISDWIAQGMCKELVDEGVAIRAGGDVMAKL